MEFLIIIVFFAGYTLIAFENRIKINKSATALLTGVVCWVIYVINTHAKNAAINQLSDHFSGIAGILFFLLGAMTIVELIDMHNGFDFISEKISTKNKATLLWIIGMITFFLSSVLDNLTTAIVMVSLSRKLIQDKKVRLWFASIIIIAANAGGAWSPIGDVTTTMLWIGGQITTVNIIKMLFFPSIVSLIIPLFIATLIIRRNNNDVSVQRTISTVPSKGIAFFFIGIGLLLFVPVFRVITNLPPFMGMFLSLSLLWIITEFHNIRTKDHDKRKPTVANALQKIDSPSILFFAGILISVAVLDITGILYKTSQFLVETFRSVHLIAVIIGLASAVFDNVPLVAATMAMFDMSIYPADHTLWELLAYSVGTGGSILIIGSAAGVAVMGMEKIDFFWYMKRISLLALAGYFAGIGIFLLRYILYIKFQLISWL
jgi:Na+/H+ antiporter NhaD/arsenite permease-like protein